MNFRSYLFAVKFALLPLSLSASDSLGELIFEDSFERNESQEAHDEVGNGWHSEFDRPWSQGRKQADLKDGVLHITPAKGDRTNLLIHRKIDLQDGSFVVRFKFPSEEGYFGMVFADMGLKDIHSGHILAARIEGNKIRLTDMLTGGFAADVWKRKKAGEQTAADKKRIASKTKRFPYKPRPNEWQEMRITIQGGEVSMWIDGVMLGSFQSEGIGHPTKKTLRLAPRSTVSLDDFRIYQPN